MESCLNVSLFNVISGATKRRERGQGGDLTCPLFENQKKCSDFGKKGPD